MHESSLFPLSWQFFGYARYFQTQISSLSRNSSPVLCSSGPISEWVRGVSQRWLTQPSTCGVPWGSWAPGACSSRLVDHHVIKPMEKDLVGEPPNKAGPCRSVVMETLLLIGNWSSDSWSMVLPGWVWQGLPVLISKDWLSTGEIPGLSIDIHGTMEVPQSWNQWILGCPWIVEISISKPSQSWDT